MDGRRESGEQRVEEKRSNDEGSEQVERECGEEKGEEKIYCER